MKAHVLSLLLFVSSTLMAASEIETLNSGGSLVGRVRIGDHKGAACMIAVKYIAEDIYSLRYETVYTEYKVKKNGSWSQIKSLDFPIQNYSGDYSGSNIRSTGHGQKKTVVSLFFDARTQAYKAILHENDYGVDTVNTGKYTVCEGMLPLASKQQ